MTTVPATPSCSLHAGVTVELHNAETLVHGYLGYTGVVPAATEATQRGLAALRAALHG